MPITSLRIRWYALALCIVLLIPPLVWTGVVLIALTGWVTRHVLLALESGTKRSIRLERMSVGWLGGVRLLNLEISSHKNGDDPWLRAPDLEIDISLFDLLRGNLRPRSVGASALDLRHVAAQTAHSRWRSGYGPTRSTPTLPISVATLPP